MADPKWEELIDCYRAAVTLLSEDINVLVDGFLEAKLITLDTYSTFRQEYNRKSKEDLTRDLLGSLMKRPSPSFNTFCAVLASQDKSSLSKKLLEKINNSQGSVPTEEVQSPSVPPVPPDRDGSEDEPKPKERALSREPVAEEKEMESPSLTEILKESQADITPQPVQVAPEDEAGKLCSLKIVPHDYQFDLAQFGVGKKNSIVIAGTGTGKTLVAAIVFHSLWNRQLEEADRLERKSKRCKSIFIVPDNALVEQQKDRFRQYLDGPKVGTLKAGCGTRLQTYLQDFDVVVMTGGLFLDYTKFESDVLEQLSLIVVDECHNVVAGQHQYNRLMKEVIGKKTSGKTIPLILGLTASPGAGGTTKEVDKATDRLIELCALLDAKDIAMHNEDSYYDPKNWTDVKRVPRRPRADSVIKHITEAMIDFENKLSAESGDELNRPAQGSRSYDIWATTLRNNGILQEKFAFQILGDCLWKLSTALEIYEDADLAAVKIHLQKAKESLKEGPRLDEKSVTEDVEHCYNSLLSKFQSVDGHPNAKLDTLKKELLRIFRSTPPEGTNSQVQVILFVCTRAQTKTFERFIRDDEQLNTVVKPVTLTGIGSESKDQMSLAKQQRHLDKFRLGECNLLVATSTAEAGIDIPSCRAIIRYSYVRNEISHVQMAGRARAKHSERILIVTEDSSDERREIRNKDRLVTMHKALKKIDEMNKEKQEKLIDEKQKIIMVELEAETEERNNRRANNMSEEVAHVTVHCSTAECETVLCTLGDLKEMNGSKLVVKGVEIFLEKVEKVKNTEEKMARQHGDRRKYDLRCKICTQSVGAIIQCKGLDKEHPCLACRKIKLKRADGSPVKLRKRWAEYENELTFKFEPFNSA